MDHNLSRSSFDPTILGILSFLAIAALIVTTSGCRDGRDITSVDEELAVVIDGNNQFAVDLYQVAAQEEGNLFFSPFSIVSALSMVYGGAEGDTETEIADVMSVEDEDSWHDNLAALSNDLCGEHNRAYSLYSANQVWGQEGVPFLDGFTTLMDEVYEAPLEEMDFIDDPDGSRKTINHWVEDETQGHIDELLGPNDITIDTRVVLANAIYFKADWADAFDTDDTRDREFTLASGDTVHVPMMTQEADFNLAWYEEDGVSLLEMPYKDDEISMVIVLPDEIDGLADVEAALTAAKLDEWIDGLHETERSVFVPTFEMETELPLKEQLETLGMIDAFDVELADFTGIVPRENMALNYYLAVARHKAYVKVDEKGTEAAAATAFVVNDFTAGSEPFMADHPFLFLIRDQLTDTILFMGRVEDPRS